MSRNAIERHKYLSTDEVQTLRNSVNTRAELDRQAGRIQGLLRLVIVELALQTGLRVSELGRIRWSDIRWTAGEIYVTRSKTKAKKACRSRRNFRRRCVNGGKCSSSIDDRHRLNRASSMANAGQ